MVEPAGQEVKSLIPGNPLELALAPRAHPQHGVFQPVRVIKELGPGITLGAKPALGKRVAWIAFKFQ